MLATRKQVRAQETPFASITIINNIRHAVNSLFGLDDMFEG